MGSRRKTERPGHEKSSERTERVIGKMKASRGYILAKDSGKNKLPATIRERFADMSRTDETAWSAEKVLKCSERSEERNYGSAARKAKIEKK